MGLLQNELRGKHLEDKSIRFRDDKVHGLLKAWYFKWLFLSKSENHCSAIQIFKFNNFIFFRKTCASSSSRIRVNQISVNEQICDLRNRTCSLCWDEHPCYFLPCVQENVQKVTKTDACITARYHILPTLQMRMSFGMPLPVDVNINIILNVWGVFLKRCCFS